MKKVADSRTDLAGWRWMALFFAAIVGGIQIPKIIEHRAWSGGRNTVLGHIDRISQGTKLREITYSYQVSGKSYESTVTDWNAFSEDTPATVTYAITNPAVSTIQPEEIERLYITSLVVAAVSVTPLLYTVVLSFRARRPKSE